MNNDKCHGMREFSLNMYFNLIVYIIYNNYDDI